MKKDIRNHPYHFEQALQRQNKFQCTSAPTVSPTIELNANTSNGLFTTTAHEIQQKQQHHQLKSTNSTYFTWLVFMYAKWVPFDGINQSKLEQSQQLGGTFVDIEDSNFPKVKRVRVFPKSNYLSYLGVKYRLSRVMQPDAWSDSHDIATPPVYSAQTQQHIMIRTLPPPPPQTSTSTSTSTTSTSTSKLTPTPTPTPTPAQTQTQTSTSTPPPHAIAAATTTTSTSSSSHNASSTMDLNYWRSSAHNSSQTLISHVIS